MGLKNQSKVLLLLSSLGTVVLSAESFDTFLKRAIANNSSLKVNKLEIKQQQLLGDISTRWGNPQLEVELSRFDIRPDEVGVRGTLSMDIPLPSVQDDKRILADSSVGVVSSEGTLGRAKYIKAISLWYVEYLSSTLLYKQSDNEIAIAKSIYDLVRARQSVGSVPEVEALRAKVAYSMALEVKESRKLKMTQSYYALLSYANIDVRTPLDPSHHFKAVQSRSQNPELALLKQQNQKNISKSKVDSHIIQNIGLFSEYEEELGEQIVRVGFSLPLPIVNQRDEEKQIAKLQLQKDELYIKRKINEQNIKLSQLTKEMKMLHKLEKQNQQIVSQEKRVLSKFEEGYKIANINLLELQEIKNRLIETQEKLIDIKVSVYRNAILQNYLRGVYND